MNDAEAKSAGLARMERLRRLADLLTAVHHHALRVNAGQLEDAMVAEIIEVRERLSCLIHAAWQEHWHEVATADLRLEGDLEAMTELLREVTR